MVRELAIRQAAAGHEVYIASTGKHTSVPGCTAFFPYCWEPNGMYSYAPGMEDWIIGLKPDVIHAHSYHALPALHAAKVAAPGQKFVFSPYYHGKSDSPWHTLRLKLYNKFGSVIFERADEVIACSQHEWDLLREHFDVDASIISPGTIDRRTGEKRGKRILCIGRLEKYKRFQNVIEALQYLPEYNLVIVGEGSYEDNLVRVAMKYDVLDQVSFYSSVSEETLAHFYSTSHCLVAMSELESFGLVVADALASGCPCVVNREGALREFEDYGLCRAAYLGFPEFLARSIERMRPVRYTKPLSTWDEYMVNVQYLYERGQDQKA